MEGLDDKKSPSLVRSISAISEDSYSADDGQTESFDELSTSEDTTSTYSEEEYEGECVSTNIKQPVETELDVLDVDASRSAGSAVEPTPCKSGKQRAKRSTRVCINGYYMHA